MGLTKNGFETILKKQTSVNDIPVEVYRETIPENKVISYNIKVLISGDNGTFAKYIEETALVRREILQATTFIGTTTGLVAGDFAGNPNTPGLTYTTDVNDFVITSNSRNGVTVIFKIEINKKIAD